MIAIVKDNPITSGLSVATVETPTLRPGWILVEVDLSGVCGSDLHTYHWTPDYQLRFRNKLPRIIGHEFTGIIKEIGSGVENFYVGQRVVARTPISCGRCVACLSGKESLCTSRLLLGVDYDGAMAEEIVVPESGCFKIPENYPPLLAALSEPISIAYNAVLKSGVLLGKTVAIVGPGAIGYIVALLVKLSGAARILVVGLPKDCQRLALFRENIPGIEAFDDVAAIKDALARNSLGPGADVVFEVSGSPKALQAGLEMVAKLGQLVLVGIVPDAVSLNTNLAVRSEIMITGSAAAPQLVWMRMLNHLAHLPQPELEKFQRVVTHRFPLHRALDAFKILEAGEGMKMMLSTGVQSNALRS
jgi:threonine 3-dehydrogenase